MNTPNKPERSSGQDVESNELLAENFTQSRKCEHKNGWRVKFKMWIFTRRAFVCSDCGEVI